MSQKRNTSVSLKRHQNSPVSACHSVTYTVT